MSEGNTFLTSCLFESELAFFLQGAGYSSGARVGATAMYMRSSGTAGWDRARALRIKWFSISM